MDLKNFIGVIKVLLKNLLTSFTDTFMSPVVWIFALGRKKCLFGTKYSTVVYNLNLYVYDLIISEEAEKAILTESCYLLTLSPMSQ